jgi:hypothetical protein
MMKLFKFLKYPPLAILLVWPWVSLGILWLLQHQAIATIPETVKPCLPHLGYNFAIVPVKLVAQTKSEAKTYYLLRLGYNSFLNHQTVYYDSVVAVHSGGCTAPYTQPRSANKALSDNLPLPVARRLTLEQLRQTRNFMGHEAFQQRIAIALTNHSAQSLPPEQVWALQQLGFKVTSP